MLWRPAVLLLAAMVAGTGLLPPDPASPSPRAPANSDPAPPWATGCHWYWTGDQEVFFCTTVSGTDLKITRVSGTIDDNLAGTAVFNGTECYLVAGNYSVTLKGTVTVFGFPVPVSWPLTGNTTVYYRIPDIAMVREVSHFTIDMGTVGSATLDSVTDASPPLRNFDFPLEEQGTWRARSDLTVWQRTSGAFGAFETTSQDSTDLNATAVRMQDVAVGAGTFSCYNISYNGTYSSGGGAPQPVQSTALYSPLVTNLAVRNFEPLSGMEVSFGLSKYTLNHAPSAASPLPEVSFPEDSTGIFDLYSAFSENDPGDRLGFVASNYTNLTVTVDNSTGIATFSAPANWSGPGTVMLRASDPWGASARAQINLTVTPMNDPPFLKVPFPDMIMDEDTVSSPLDLSDHFDDPDIPYGDRLNFSVRDNGSVAVSVTPSGVVTLRPFENWSGLQERTFIATDGEGAWAAGALKVAVLNTPDAPVVTATEHQFEILEDASLATDLSRRFWDADIPYGDALTFTVEHVLAGCVVQLDERAGELDLTPPRDFFGAIELGYVATDRSGRNATEEVRLMVSAVNDPPVILGSFPAGDRITLAENTSADFSVVESDIDGILLNITWYLDGHSAGAGANFTCSADFRSAGEHNLTAVATDGFANVSRSWNLSVTNVNRPPEKVRITLPANGSKFRTADKVHFAADAQDPDGDALSYTWKDTDGRILGVNRSIEVNKLTVGKHVVTVEVSDGNATVTASVTLSVSPPAAARTPGFGAAAVLAAGTILVLRVKGRGRARRPHGLSAE